MSDAYLVLITWPEGHEGLLFPRPGNVQVADTLEQGQIDYKIANRHLREYYEELTLRGQSTEAIDGAVVRLVKFERKEVIEEHKHERTNATS